MFTNRSQLDRVIKARRSLIQDGNAFYGALTMYLDVVERLDIETAATDGRSFFYNPNFVATLTDSELVGLWCHEVSHVSLLHHARIGDRDLKEANVAADLAINQDLVRQGFKLPKGALLDTAFDGMGFEEIFAVRMQAKRKEEGQNGQNGKSGSPGNAGNQPGNQPGNGPSVTGDAGNGQGEANSDQPGNGSREVNGIGGIMKPGSGSQGDAEAEAETWRIRVTEAAAIAKRANAGKLPGNVARILETVREPQLDVRDLLARFVDSMVSTSTTWSRPNRRTIGQGIYLPSHSVDGLEHVVFAVDTSGSIDAHMLANAAAEITAAHGDGRIQNLTVIFADTRVQAVQEFGPGDDIALTPKGGGGTRFADTFRHIADECGNATAVIYLTDLEVTDQADWIEPDCPVLFAVHGDSRQFDEVTAGLPFGEPIYVGRLE